MMESLSPATRWCISGLVVATLVGTVVDTPIPMQSQTRGGWRVLQVDFHAHTRFSDGFLSPPGLVLQARRRGLDALAVTEHNMVLPAKIARTFSDWIGGPIIMVGQEVTNWRFHMHAIGIQEAIDAHLSVEDAIAEIHRQGGVAIAAHPVEKYWPTYAGVMDQLDGTEVGHPLIWAPRRAGWAWEHMVEFYERARASGTPLTAIGASDYHFFSPLGVIRTLVFVDPKNVTAAGIIEAVRARRTVVEVDPEDGGGLQRFGSPALIPLIASAPLVANGDPDYGYRGAGVIDVLARWLGLLSLLGLILLRRTPQRPVADEGAASV